MLQPSKPLNTPSPQSHTHLVGLPCFSTAARVLLALRIKTLFTGPDPLQELGCALGTLRATFAGDPGHSEALGKPLPSIRLRSDDASPIFLPVTCHLPDRVSSSPPSVQPQP